ncbi:class I SAM-dependent methyltransferase [Scytonema sp. PCC 10023]|uniref:class I SAM-dependent methyltransferase n=1 Tax=Scytonema sp. PCC 10023 TaxID=1680591 RepID=UPI0039C6969A
MVTTNYQERVFLAQAGYTKTLLSNYDALIGFNARFLWKCARPRLLKFYNKNISANHLEVGVGSGYYLDKCRFPVDKPRIVLLDLNPNSLEFTSARIRRYQPTICQGSVLEPISLEANQFDSIGFNYVLHCLPGTLAQKAATAFENLKPLLKEGGILFGSTVLGEGVKHNYLGKRVMKNYNSRGIFNNYQDKVSDLEAVLKPNFSTYSVQVIGCTALFTARK